MVKPISFAAYYLRLRLEVMLGMHKTANPLGLKWRWRHWDHIRDVRFRN